MKVVCVCVCVCEGGGVSISFKQCGFKQLIIWEAKGLNYQSYFHLSWRYRPNLMNELMVFKMNDIQGHEYALWLSLAADNLFTEMN